MSISSVNALVAVLALCAFAAPASASAPTVESDGSNLILTTDDSGDISFSSGEKAVTLTELRQALADIADLKEQLKTCTDDVDLLKNEVASNSLQVEVNSKVQGNVDINAKSVADAVTSIANLKEAQDDESDGIQSELSALAEKVNTVLDKMDVPKVPTCAAIGEDSIDANLKIHSSVLTTEHVVGFKLHLACKDGYSAVGVTEMACFPSGNYCDAAQFPSGSCSTSEAMPTCKECPNKCATCAPNGGGCTSCDKGTFLTKGACTVLTNCKGYYGQGSLKQPVSTYEDIGLGLMLSDGRSTTKGVCLLDGDEGRVYEVFPCTALLTDGGERGCKPATTATAANTCSDAGYMLFTFRNAKHYALMVEAYGLTNFYRYIKTVPVTLNLDSQPPGRPYTKCALNSEEGGDCATDWEVPDGGDWFIRSMPYGEPNGDARKGWFLSLQRFGETEVDGLNDGRGPQSTGTLYLCVPRDD